MYLAQKCKSKKIPGTNKHPSRDKKPTETLAKEKPHESTAAHPENKNMNVRSGDTVT